MHDEIAAVFFGIAAAFVAVVWAMSPTVGAKGDKREDTPLDRNALSRGSR